MRKLLLAGLLISALIIACETKTPVGPGVLSVTQTTTSTTVPATTTTTTPTTTPSTTTSSVTGGAARRYVAFNPPPNIPGDMTLFFELIFGTPVSSLVARLPIVGSPVVGVAGNEYKVTGVYTMQNGTTGQAGGTLGGQLNPLENGGDFNGTLSATTTSGCSALKQFSGRLTSQTLEWNGGDTLQNNCATNPLFMSSLQMFRADGAPLPTTTIPPSTTTTTSVQCAYTLQPTSATFPAAGGTGQVSITTTPGCPWSAQSFAAFITVLPPVSGSGSGAVSYTVAPGTAARTGSMRIAGQDFIVTQGAPVTTTTSSSTTSTSSSTTSTTSPSTTSTTTTTVTPLVDLVPVGAAGSAPPDSFCRISSGPLLVNVANQGKADAPTSATRVTFATSTGPASVVTSTPPIAVGGNIDVSFAVPSNCFNPDCSFTILVNATSAFGEINTANNTAAGRCIG
jgi:hypothetical protein